MPELPEVEVVTQGLRPHLVGKKIVSFWHSGKPLRYPVPFGKIKQEMLEKTITTVTRRAKFLQITLDSGAELIIHLGMTGNLGFFGKKSRRKPHTHLEWDLDNGKVLRYQDVRRFGSAKMLTAAEAKNKEKTIFCNVGPEPFSPAFTATYLQTRAKKRSISVKQFLMTNQIVCGIGNIYANESLFHAGINPRTPAKNLSQQQWSFLVQKIRDVLTHAIECGGSTISDFLNAGQKSGYFQINFAVYGKNGQKCSHCQAIIEKQVIAGRASYYCPQCQKR
ncbi:MAG: formamidopyrimidine-DNA glycosylase [Desulfobacterales bacterium]|nr:MAG: formamidopyrimidine-DNA glycosylase [Desulfobacterales bacterium]